MSIRIRTIFVLAISCLLAVSSLLAQTSTTGGQIIGTVNDNTGSALPGVTVTATNTETGLTRSALTELDGTYTLQLLPPGIYRVEAELSGLGKATRERVSVLLGLSSKTDLAINPSLAQEITVTASTPVVDATQSDLTSSVTQDQIENLPLLGRDFTDLVKLTPGTGETFNGGVSLNGARGIAADYNIDGAETNSDFFGQQRGGTASPFTFSQAAIREFQVIRSSFSAEFSRGVGGTMNAVTKSGTNELDGQLFYFFRDGEWASERSLTLPDGSPLDDSFLGKNSAQYGFALGGPIVQDRLHYFLNTDFQDISTPVRIGDIRQRTDFQALPEATRTAFVQRVETLLGRSLNDLFAYDQSEDQQTYLIKLDANVAQNHHLSFRDNYSKFVNENNQNGRNLAYQGTATNEFNQAVLQAESVFTSSIFNQVILQYGNEERPINPSVTNLPDINITGAIPFRFGQIDFLPNNTTEDKWQLKDTLSIAVNNHQFKTGFEVLSTSVDNLFTRDEKGEFRFASIADFVAGRPSGFDQGLGPGDGHNAYDYDTYGVFVHDTWTPFKKLTLDLGVRYDYQTTPTPINNIAPEYPEFVTNFEEDDDNVAPRFGFAYDLFGSGRSVVRGGVGQYYNNLPAIILANPLAQIGGIFNNISIPCSATSICPTFPNIFTREQFQRQPVNVRDIAIVGKNLQASEALRGLLAFEQQFGTAYSVGIEGVYSKLDKQQRFVNINATPTGLMYGDLVVYDVTNPNRLYPRFQNVRQHVNDAEGSYSSLTLTTKKLAVSGSKFSYLAHYTWSEAIDQDSNERSTSTHFSLDPYNPEFSEGRADYDVTHRVVLSGNYQLPFGINVAGIGTWRTGTPYTRSISSPGGNPINGLNGFGIEVPVFVDGSGKVIDLTQASGLSRSGFSQFLAARNATVGDRNNENQADSMNLDLKISKRFSIFRDLGLELGAEVFNVTNENNEQVTNTNAREFITAFNATTDRFTFTRNANFGRATSFAGQPRQYQASLKLLF